MLGEWLNETLSSLHSVQFGFCYVSNQLQDLFYFILYDSIKSGDLFGILTPVSFSSDQSLHRSNDLCVKYSSTTKILWKFVQNHVSVFSNYSKLWGIHINYKNANIFTSCQTTTRRNKFCQLTTFTRYKHQLIILYNWVSLEKHLVLLWLCIFSLHNHLLPTL